MFLSTQQVVFCFFLSGRLATTCSIYREQYLQDDLLIRSRPSVAWPCESSTALGTELPVRLVFCARLCFAGNSAGDRIFTSVIIIHEVYHCTTILIRSMYRINNMIPDSCIRIVPSSPSEKRYSSSITVHPHIHDAQASVIRTKQAQCIMSWRGRPLCARADRRPTPS